MKWIKLSDELPPFNKEIVLLSERGSTRLTFRKPKEAIIKTGSSDVIINGDAHNISTMSGDVRCKTIEGSVSTMSGDVTCDNIKGNCSTMNGDIRR